MFLEEEYRPLYEGFKKSPGPQTSGALLRAVSPVIDSAVRSYGGQSPAPHVFSHARRMALDAFDSYRPEQAKLRTHLMSHLRGLHRVAARSQQIIGLPERVALDVGRLHRSEKELEDVLGRRPSTAELSDHMRLPIEKIDRLRTARPGLSEGQVLHASSLGPSGLGGGDDEAPDPASVVPGGNARQNAWLDFVYHDLSPTDQLIFEHASGHRGRKVLPKGVIAARLGLTPGAVSHRLKKIQEKIDYRDSAENLF